MKYNKETREVWEIEGLPIATISQSVCDDKHNELGQMFAYSDKLYRIVVALHYTSDIEKIVEIKEHASKLFGEIYKKTVSYDDE